MSSVYHSLLLRVCVCVCVQVSSLTIELMAENKISEELRSQLTLARAEVARHQTNIQRAGSLASPPPPHLTTLGLATHTVSTARDSGVSSSAKEPDTAASQKKGHVIDL